MTGETSAAYFHSRFSNTVLSENGNVVDTLCTYVLFYGVCVSKNQMEYVTKSPTYVGMRTLTRRKLKRETGSKIQDPGSELEYPIFCFLYSVLNVLFVVKREILR